VAVEVEIEINPLDLVRSGQKFVYKKGQNFVKGEFVVEDGGENIIPDQSSIIFIEE